MPEEQRNTLGLGEPSRDVIIGYLTSYISCLKGILEDRQEQLKNAEYNIKKAISAMPYVLDEQKTKLLEEEISSIKAHIGFTKGEIVSVETAKAVTRYYSKIKNSNILCDKTGNNISS